MPERPPDVVELARILNDHGLEWVLVGGMAMVLHGSAYVTTDIDFAIAFSSRNDPRLVAAFLALGARPSRWQGDDPFMLDPKLLASPFLEFQSNCGSFHLLNRLPGVESFDALRRNALSIVVDGVTIPVASLEDLIKMKAASSRQKDQVHLAELRALKESSEA